MTAKEAAAKSPEGCARRYQDGFAWIWKADINEGFRTVSYERNGDPKLFARLKVEEIENEIDWEPLLDDMPRIRKRCPRRLL